ncbi:hypothetical protein Bbelb_150720 [Branchiostoma belcheri]|nr:hypothetical protein Bbelb_150720 [Branchiostoma belcheri]
MSLVELIGYWQSSAVTFRTVLFVSNLHATEHLYAHTWSTVRLYGIPTPSVVPRRWSESNEGRREWLSMGEFRTLVLAKVLSVRDSCCLYASCTHCYRKLHQHTDGNRYECLRCHAVYIAADIRYRYCLNLTVTDDQTLCEVAVFGTCLEPFFGISANGLKSFLQNHLKTSKASTPNNPDSLLHEALQKSLVGLMFLFGFKVKCERSRSQRERHSPVRIRSILEKTCQQRNGYLGKNLPQLVAHQMVHANRDTPFVSVLDLLKWIILETDDNKARETSTSEFGVPRNTLPSRRSVNSSDISWCSGNSARTSFGQTLSRVSLGQQSLVLSCDEGNSLMSSTMSDDLQNESDEKTDSSINHSTYSWDETYYEENLQLHSESYYFHANASEVAKRNEVCDVQVEGIDGRMENRACSATRRHVVIDDVGGGGNVQEGRNDVHQECSNTSGCENMSAQFLEGAFDETCWEGETPGNLSHEEQQSDHQSDRGDSSAMGARVQKEQAAAIVEMCHDCTHLHTSNETCGDSEVEALYNPQLAGQEAYSWTHEHDIPTCKTSTEDEVPNEELSFDESVNDSYLLLAELNSDGMHMPEKDNNTDHFDCCSDQTHDVCKREVDPTHQGSSSDSEDVRHHETKTSCDDLPYSEGLDTFIDQLDQPVQGPLERLHLDAFLAEMDENITVESERKEDVHVVKETAQRPIEDETDICVTSVETTVDIRQYSEKGETSSTKFPTGDKSVEQPQDSTENVVFMAASEENHDFSALFDESFGHLSDTESVGSCRDSCGEVGGVNELPDTPGPPSRAASVLRASRTSTRSFNMENTETSPVTKNRKILAATTTRLPTECDSANSTRTECGNLHATTSDCDSPDSSPNELADTPHDNKCRSFLSARGASFNSTAGDRKVSDSAYSSSNFPGAEKKNESSEEPQGKEEKQRRKSVHFSSHLESVHEVSQVTGTEEVLPSGKKVATSVARIKTPMSGEGTPNFFSQLSPTSANRRHVRVAKSVGKYDSTPNFFSQCSPRDSGSDGIVPGTEDRPCRRRVSCMLKNVVRFPVDDAFQGTGTPDLFETSLHGDSEGGDLGASPDLFGDSPIPDSPVNVRPHTGVMSLCKRLFHRQ